LVYNKETMFNTDPYEAKMKGALEHFSEDIKKIRTGRAHPSMLDSVRVEVYGTKMPLNQAANILAPEPSMLQVSPFDPSNVTAITAAIRADQGLGFNPSDDGRIIRVPVPPLTEERRRELVKQVAGKVEDTKIALRNVRQDAIKDAKRMKDAKEISQDDQTHIEREIDKLMSAHTARLEQIAADKEKDILTI